MAPIKWCWKRRWWSSEAEAKVEDALSAFEHRPQLPDLFRYAVAVEMYLSCYVPIIAWLAAIPDC